MVRKHSEGSDVAFLAVEFECNRLPRMECLHENIRPLISFADPQRGGWSQCRMNTLVSKTSPLMIKILPSDKVQNL